MRRGGQQSDLRRTKWGFLTSAALRSARLYTGQAGLQQTAKHPKAQCLVRFNVSNSLHVRLVPHLRRSEILRLAHPALTRWAKLCRAYGADCVPKEDQTFRLKRSTRNPPNHHAGSRLLYCLFRAEGAFLFAASFFVRLRARKRPFFPPATMSMSPSPSISTACNSVPPPMRPP